MASSTPVADIVEAVTKASERMVLEFHHTHLMLWQSLANTMLTSKVIERHALSDSITDVIEQMGADAIGLPEQAAQAMKDLILSGVVAVPEIDPSTKQSLDEISNRG